MKFFFRSFEFKYLTLSSMFLIFKLIFPFKLDLAAFLIGIFLLLMNTYLIRAFTATLLQIAKPSLASNLLPLLQVSKYPLFFIICAWIFPKYHLEAAALFFSIFFWVLALIWQGLMPEKQN